MVPILVWGPEKMRGDVPSQAGSQEARGANSSFLHLLFYVSPQWIGWCPPTLGRAACFSKSTNSNANLIGKDSHRYTQRCFIWAFCGQSSWCTKLTITPGIPLSILQCTKQPPWRRVFLSKMSTVQKLRNSDLAWSNSRVQILFLLGLRCF